MSLLTKKIETKEQICNFLQKLPVKICVNPFPNLDARPNKFRAEMLPHENSFLLTDEEKTIFRFKLLSQYYITSILSQSIDFLTPLTANIFRRQVKLITEIYSFMKKLIIIFRIKENFYTAARLVCW